MKEHWGRRLTAFLTAAVMLAGYVWMGATPAAAAQESDPIDISGMVHNADSYTNYLAAYEADEYLSEEIVISGGDYLEASEDFQVLKNYEGRSGNSLLTREEGSVTYEVEVPKAGLYQIALT